MDIQIYRSYREVDPFMWDSLIAPDDIFSSYKFIKTVEKAQLVGSKYWYIMVFDQGEVLSSLVLFQMPVNLDNLIGNSCLTRVCEAIRSIFPKFLTFKPLVSGLPVSLGRNNWRFKLGLSLTQKSQIVREVTSVIEKIADQCKAKVVAIKEMFDNEVEVFQSLCETGFFQGASLPTNYLQIYWPNFTGYIEDLRSKYRQNMSYNLKKINSSFCVEVIKNFADIYDDRLFSFYLDVMKKAKIKLEVLTKEFFQEFSREFPDDAVLVSIKKDKEIVGYFLSCFTPNSMVAMFTGLDYQYNYDYDIYFNLFIEVIRQACDEGKKYIDFGQNSYQIKARMGCQPRNLSIFLKHRIGWVHRLLYKYNEYFFPRINLETRNVFKSRPSTEGGII